MGQGKLNKSIYIKPRGINIDTRLQKEKRMFVTVKYNHFPKTKFCFCLQKSGGILFHINENKRFDNEHFVFIPNVSQVSPALAKYIICHHKSVDVLISLGDEQCSGWTYSYDYASLIHHKSTIGTGKIYFSESNTDQQISGERSIFYLC